MKALRLLVLLAQLVLALAAVFGAGWALWLVVAAPVLALVLP